MRKSLLIESMSCGHCVMYVKTALSDISGVYVVYVDLAGRKALVEGARLDDEEMRAALAEAGYEVTAIDPA
jgi:copper chaperone CopZ